MESIHVRMERLAKALEVQAQAGEVQLQAVLDGIAEVRSELVPDVRAEGPTRAAAVELLRHCSNAVMSVVVADLTSIVLKQSVVHPDLAIFHTDSPSTLNDHFRMRLEALSVPDRFRLVSAYYRQLGNNAISSLTAKGNPNQRRNIMLLDERRRFAASIVQAGRAVPDPTESLEEGLFAGDEVVLRLGEGTSRLYARYGLPSDVLSMSRTFRGSRLLSDMMLQSGVAQGIEIGVLADCLTNCHSRDLATVMAGHHGELVPLYDTLEDFRSQHLGRLMWVVDNLRLVPGLGGRFGVWTERDMAEEEDPATGIRIADLPIGRGVSCPMNGLRSRRRMLDSRAAALSDPLLWPAAYADEQSKGCGVRAFDDRPLAPLPFLSKEVIVREGDAAFYSLENLGLAVRSAE